MIKTNDGTDEAFVAGKRLKLNDVEYEAGEDLPTDEVNALVRLETLLQMKRIVRKVTAPVVKFGRGVATPAVEKGKSVIAPTVEKIHLAVKDDDDDSEAETQIRSGIPTVMEWVGHSKKRARVAKEKELETTKPRKRLIDKLNVIIDV